MANQIGSRLVFENAKSFIQGQGYDTSHAVLTQSYIRSEVALSSTVTNYHIPVVINDQTNGAAFNTEKRLQLQDVAVACELGIFVCLPSSATDTTFKLLTYPTLNTGGFSAGQATALYSLYNGSFNITVNNQQILPNWDVYRHYFVPRTQNGALAATGAVAPIDENDGSSFGFVPVEPNLLLNGAANIQANITLPGAVGTVATNSRIVVIFRTILAQNVTSVK
jgi:hypothetical protein